MSFLDPHASSPKAEQRGRFFWRTLPRVCLIAVFRGYQLLISPLFPPVCRYTPSCSQYAIEAVSRHGVLRGGGMAIWRILRCHPFARGGYDPVK